MRRVVDTLTQSGTAADKHVAAEILRQVFDLDAVCYFVAPDWWAPQSRRHANLGLLDEAAQREEIVGSRDDLASLLGSAPTTVAYPFGMKGSFDRTTERIVRDAGFTLACANVPGRLVSRNRFRLPRHVVGSWSGDELGHRLEGWLRANR